MRLLQILQCLSDETRLRIVLLLSHRPLGVRHLQTILGASQVRISKHLICLKRNEVVESRVAKNWRIYRLPDEPGYELGRCLECLRDCVRHSGVFAEDLARLQAMTPELKAMGIAAGKTPDSPKARVTEAVPTGPEQLEDHLL
jgi:ArsR family transcriptional regulator, arsenate/arsenite/antimonite-responsive transcriptional repressor